MCWSGISAVCPVFLHSLAVDFHETCGDVGVAEAGGMSQAFGYHTVAEAGCKASAMSRGLSGLT